jgi:hypothetical protein
MDRGANATERMGHGTKDSVVGPYPNDVVLARHRWNGASQEISQREGVSVMAANVTLTIHGGALDGKEFTFKEPTKCVIGRAEDCLIQLPASREEFQLVSRHHCELDLAPPCVRVRDLGSLNGTFINETFIGHRPRMESAELAEPRVFPFFDLHTGDQLWVGPILFEVKVTGAVAAHMDTVPTNEEPFNQMALAI